MAKKKTNKQPEQIIGYKGFNPDWTCTPAAGVTKQYKVGETYIEDESVLCEKGLHFYENPGHIFGAYGPVGVNGQLNKFARVIGEGTSKECGDNSKRVCTKLTIEAELNFMDIIKARIEWAKKYTTTGRVEAGDRGVATAGDFGVATAGYRGVATAGYSGAATAGYRGVATAGYFGVATAGDSGTATAGYHGAATAGDSGTATAGYSGAATSRGSVSVGESGCGLVRGWNVRSRGGLNAVLTLCEEIKGDHNIKAIKTIVIDGEQYKSDVWYCIGDSGEVEEASDEQA